LIARNFAFICVALVAWVAASTAATPAASQKKSSKTTTKKTTAKKTTTTKSSTSKSTSTKKTTAKRTIPSSKRSVYSSSKKRTTASRTTKKKVVARRSWRNVQKEPTSERYKEIQQALAAKGYLDKTPDGVWSDDSVEALKHFQQDQNLEATGKITSLSLIALGLGPKYDEPHESQ
jgi:Ni/Co efflux regulator RcnB